jgi:hypothetical protein
MADRDFMGFYVPPKMYQSLIEQLKKEPYSSMSDMIRAVLAQWLIFNGHQLGPDDIKFNNRRTKKW